ncbi:phosphotransferase enzyme family protein [Nitzschia inconspicua]|uniref:Phosphotransferase enzyme family protein n=1 Tax=Nitzschia inconspicua TaxID=303405 RepID=A0A9K3KUT7_9STRA|nr:phosphotransferase enzyme family protein [Nitzschia inconspicua]
MLRLRTTPNLGRIRGNSPTEWSDDNTIKALQKDDDTTRKPQRRDRNPYAPPLPLLLLIVWCIIQSYWNFQSLMKKNLGLELQDQLSTPSLRTNTGFSTNSTSLMTSHSLSSTMTSCPALPDRLLHHHADLLSPPLLPLTHQDVQQQMKLRKRDRMGTMGDSILLCPSHFRSRVDPNGRIRTIENDPLMKSCRGIMKQYQSPAVYRHVKRCLTLLNGTGIAPRLLYSDDATLTLVEEDKGFLTMRNSPIPVDFDQQLRRILCILRHYSIVHRDLTYPNFVIDEVTGMLYIIDFGDSHVGAGANERAGDYWNWRNVQNLFNIWWNSYDEEARMEEFITKTIPEIRGSRQWRPPTHQWTSLSQNKMGSLLLSRELVK